jgi:hypothetical protein
MGKKLRGAKLRAYQKAREAADELQESQADAAAIGAVARRDDAELFVVDKSGDAASRVYKNAVATGSISRKDKKPKGGLSDHDLERVERLQQRHGRDAQALRKLAERGRKQAQLGRNKRHRSVSSGGKSSQVSYDLWGDGGGGEDEEGGRGGTDGAKRAKTTEAAAGIAGKAPAGIRPDAHVRHGSGPRFRGAPAAPDAGAAAPVRVDVASAGQSYLPDPVLHRAALRRAAEVEARRAEAARRRRAPLSAGLSEETRRLIVGDSSDEEEGEDEDKDDPPGEDAGEEEAKANGASPPPPQGRSAPSSLPPLPLKSAGGKLTAAMRNKQKRARQERAELERLKRSKWLLGQVGQAGTYRKQIRKRERELEERRERLRLLKESARRAPGRGVELALSLQDPLAAPSVPVALPSELSSAGSPGPGGAALRTLRPKGSLVADRYGSLADRGMAPRRNPAAGAARSRRVKVRGSVRGPGFEIRG